MIHDGWTKGAVHFFGLYTSIVGSNGKVVTRLLSVEPMMAECVDNEHDLAAASNQANNLEEVDGVCKILLKRSTTFGAQAMHGQKKRVMKRFGVYLDQGTDPKSKCIVSDNTQCNQNLALLLLIPFVNCFAHLWALSMS